MTFLLAGLLIRPVVWLLGVIHGMANRVHYDGGAIHEARTENRLRNDIDDRPNAEDERPDAELAERLSVVREPPERPQSRTKVIR